MKVEELAPERHDEVLAMISHLPHLVAYALVGAVGEYDRKEHPALAFTAGGFKDFTRIAASSPEMWRQIIEQNAALSLKALERFSARLDEIRRAISEKRWGDLEKLFDAAAQVRRGLDKETSS
jgi:prephenate dehydrogenase